MVVIIVLSSLCCCVGGWGSDATHKQDGVSLSTHFFLLGLRDGGSSSGIDLLDSGWRSGLSLMPAFPRSRPQEHLPSETSLQRAGALGARPTNVHHTPSHSATRSNLSRGGKDILSMEVKRCVHICACASSVAQWCMSLCTLVDCSLQGSCVHGILQARTLKWVVISSRGSSWPRDRNWSTALHILYLWDIIWRNRRCLVWRKWFIMYVKAVYCHRAYLTSMQGISGEMLGWMKHKMESRLPGEISITSDMQRTPTLWQKTKRIQRASWWRWNRRVKKLA